MYVLQLVKLAELSMNHCLEAVVRSETIQDLVLFLYAQKTPKPYFSSDGIQRYFFGDSPLYDYYFPVTAEFNGDLLKSGTIINFESPEVLIAQQVIETKQMLKDEMDAKLDDAVQKVEESIGKFWESLLANTLDVKTLE